MKKRFAAAALSVALSLSAFTTVKAASPVDIHYNDWDMPVSGYLQNGTTYVPIRQFFQLLGGSWVDWNEARRSATVKGNVSATFYLDSPTAWYSGTRQRLTGKTYSRDGTMYVPLRGLAEAMECDISYDGIHKRVTLSSEPAQEKPVQTPSQNKYDEDALFWLSRIIEAESGGEPYLGKLAVGNVILNRVSSTDFPNTIYGVIFDRKNGVQFTPVANGTIYNTPSADSIRAAKECLDGKQVVGKCLYFFNPKTSTKEGWIVSNCRYYTSIGDHDFYLPPRS